MTDTVIGITTGVMLLANVIVLRRYARSDLNRVYRRCRSLERRMSKLEGRQDDVDLVLEELSAPTPAQTLRVDEVVETKFGDEVEEPVKLRMQDTQTTPGKIVQNAFFPPPKRPA